MSALTTGTVKWFDAAKGFGFIEQQSGPDVFVHFKNIINTSDYKTLEENQEVEFSVSRGPKGPQAENVKVVG